MSADTKPVAHSVQALAEYAALNLSPEQQRIVGPIVEAWRDGSLALNEVMRAAQHAGVVPITVLSQLRDPDPEG